MRLILNQRGDSLIGTLCSIAIMATMMAGASTYIHNFSVSNRHLRMSLESTQFALETEHILSRGNGCMDSLKDKILPALTTKELMPKLALSQLVQGGTVLAAVGIDIGETGKINGLHLTADRQISPTEYIASIRIGTSDRQSQFSSSRAVKVSVQTDASRRITGCSVMNSGGGTSTGGTCPGDRMVDGNGSLQMLGKGLPLLPEGQLTQQIGTPVNGCTCRMGFAPNNSSLWHCVVQTTPTSDSP